MSPTAAAKLARTASEMRQGTERHEVPEVIVGKDVLELVSSAMYVDPMSVYREYVQNAADAVDIARAEGLLGNGEPGRVNFYIDHATRTVRIRDNGCAVPFNAFGRKLTSLGGSGKRGSLARGFRGVGRLAGLGYAQELVFRSRASGETKISELRWDCRRLKSALRDAGDDTGVAELIRAVTSLERGDVGDAPDRFFEVEMRGIVRLRNDRLMNPTAIGDYLSQVAPVPFSPEFRFGAEITKALSRHFNPGELDIRIDGTDAPLYRPHRDRFVLEDKSSISFDGLSMIEIPGIDGELAAIGWVAHHEYEGAVPAGTLIKGLRLRAGNIQVGGHALLEDLFPEPRFNAWSVGEVHVLDRRIVPNGRRDHFEQNAHFHNVLNHLTPTARDVARRCRTSSVRRKWEREFAMLARAVDQDLLILAQGSISQGQRARLALQIEQTFMKMSQVARMELLSDEVAGRLDVIETMRSRLGALMQDVARSTSPLTRLPEEQRKTYEHLFDLVYECSANKTAAKALVDRIMLRLAPEA
jgi:hypothetical protein